MQVRDSKDFLRVQKEQRGGLQRRMLFLAAVVSLTLFPGFLAAQTNSGTSNSQTSKKAGSKNPLCVHKCSSTQEAVYDLKNETYTGETVRGPKTIVAKNLNILRYNYTASSKVTFSQPPDLWSKLTGLASPQSEQGGTVPQKTATPTAAEKALTQKATAAKAANVKPGVGAKVVAGNQPKYSAAVLTMNDKIQKAVDEAQQAIDQVNAETDGFDQPLHDELTAVAVAVKAQVVKANTATDNVAAGGQELLSFLKAVDASSTYDGITKELSSDSKFMKGVNAEWPASSDIVNLKQAADLRKTRLASIQTDLSSKQASLTASLMTAERDLYAAREAVNEVPLQVANPTKDDQDLIDADGKLVAKMLGLVGTSNEQLKGYGNLVSWGVSVNDGLETALSSLDTTGSGYKAFQQAQASLSDWQQQMLKVKSAWDLHSAPGADQSLHPDPFVMRFSGNCDYAFSTTKQTAITLTAVDQLPDKSAAAPATVLSVTIECASPFTVSAGVAFTSIPSREYAIQPVATPPNSTTTTNQFVFTANSNFHPVVIGMVSARLCEPNEKVSYHLSFGMAGNFNSQNAGGSSAEFLIGPSLALFRTMFITPGLYIGKKTVLADGFSVGSPVPPNVTTVPLQSSYKPAFGLAITFTKP